MIELSNEFKMFLGRGMYRECSKVVIIKIRELMLSKINEHNKTFYSENLSEIANEYVKIFDCSNKLLEELIILEDENEDDDQVERLSKLMEMYNNIEES